MPKKEEKERKKLVVEEVSTPVDNEVVSSSVLEKEEKEETKGEILEEAVKTESAEEIPSPGEEMQKEIHEEEKRLHDIHTNAPVPVAEKVSEEIVEKKGGNPILWILIPGIFLLGALLGGVVFYQKGISQTATPTPSPSPEATVAPAASSTPLPKAELQKYPIKIQNGSGIPGAAGEAKDILTKAGFKVSGTGNASTYDYTDTVIEAKADVPKAFIDQLSAALSQRYTLGTNVILKESSTDQVIVIVGSSKAK